VNEAISKNEQEKIFQEQDDQYQFPYHYIPHFLADNTATRVRDLDWGFDYLACLYYAKKSVEDRSPKSVLEVGCGDGAIIGAIDQDIPRRVGVDLSSKAIAFAKAFHSNVDFKPIDANKLTETFDAVIAVEVLEHIPDDQVTAFLQSLANRTNKGGIIYISVPSINLPLYSKHYRHYDPALLQSQIEQSGIDVDVEELCFFRSPVRFENIYKRLTNNRLWIGEFHPLRRIIWKNIINSLDKSDTKTAQHVIAVLKKK